MFRTLEEWRRAMFEGNRCKFSKECGDYRDNNVVCNNWTARFLPGGNAYCDIAKARLQAEKTLWD